MNLPICLNVKNLKWLLLVIFPIGYLLTHKYFITIQAEFALYNIFALISLIILLYNINLSNRKFRPIWVALVLFLMGYFIRFYWVTIDPIPVERMLPWNPFRTMIADRDALFLSFQFSVIAFASFCCSVCIFLYFFKDGTKNKLNNLQNQNLNQKIGRILIILVLFAMVFLAYASYRFQIGEMGSSSSSNFLPFRLKGLIFYTRVVCIPILILLCINILEQTNDIIGSRVGILILIINGFIDMFLRNSRSSLLLALLLLIFLLLAGGLHLRLKEKVFLVIIAVLAFVMVPVMTEYRQIRLTQNLSQFDALLILFQSGESSWLLQFTQGLKFVLFRMPGIESLWCQLALGARPLGIYSLDIINSTNGIAGYLTYVIHPLKEAKNTLLAPGFVGWLYLVGGLPIIIVGSFCIGFISVLVWTMIDTFAIKANAAAKAFFLWMLFLALTEGTLDSMGLMLIAGIATLVFIELFFSRINFNNLHLKP